MPEQSVSGEQGRIPAVKRELITWHKNNSSSVITDLGDTGSYFMENVFSDVLLNVAADG